jgi:dienelactone hydrolase
MKKIMTYETLRNFTYSNDNLIEGRIKGVVLNFMGLNFNWMIENSAEGSEYAARGILYVIPYYNPWCWMNAQAVAWVDEVLDVLFDHYQLPKDTPIVSTGVSMGGLCALTYCAYAKRTPCACVTNCPVCDLPYHFTERPDLPRTLYSALWEFDGTPEEALRSRSPLHLCEKMPKIPYTVFHCEKDQAVNFEKHGVRFAEAMKAAGHEITLVPVPVRGHGDLSPKMKVKYDATVQTYLGLQ